MAKKRLLVVCPGRGSYTAESLGYLKSRAPEFIHQVDSLREKEGLPSITELDQAERFKVSLHTRGEHASPLIYSCAYTDFIEIDRDEYDIVAVTGNSMGWYLALAMSGSLNVESAFKVIQTMGSMMKDGLLGGQIIYPLVSEDWNLDPKRANHLEATIERLSQRKGVEIYNSIFLGGYRVIGANKEGLRFLLEDLEPVDDKYPFQLVNHGAFHTPLCEEISKKAFDRLGLELFSPPQIPLIDGMGRIWSTYNADLVHLREYTLGYQVVKAYDFTTAITVGIKEYAPDQVMLLGPGNSLGGVIGQIFAQNKWCDIRTKWDFTSSQKLISVGVR